MGDANSPVSFATCNEDVHCRCQHLLAENVAQVNEKRKQIKANDRLFNGLEVCFDESKSC